MLPRCVAASSRVPDPFVSPSLKASTVSDSQMGNVRPRYNAAPTQVPIDHMALRNLAR